MAKLTIRFEIRQDKLNQDGNAPISCIMSVSQQRKRIATELSIPAANWDKSAQKAIYRNRKEFSKISGGNKPSVLLMESDIDRINGLLEKIRSRLNFIEDGFRLNDKTYTVENIFSKYQESLPSIGKKMVEKQKRYIPTVPDFINTYIERNKASRAKRSLGVYSQLKSHLEDFEKWSFKKVTFDRIGLSFFEEFQNYLIEHKASLNNITIAKQLSTLKTLLGYARKHGIEMNQSFRDFTIKRQKLEVITLSEGEYRALKEVDLKGVSRHEKARDIFIFLCATSMRYSDYDQFKREHIKGQTIQLTMKKGSKLWEIPLNPDSISILEKYKDLAEPLPKISNPKLSKYIKEICAVAKINEPVEIVRYKGAEPIRNVYPKHKLVSAHTGRKTFCTLSLERGASVETVMKWSGHESYASFKRYVNLSRTHSIKEMERVWGKTEIMKAV
ncbi:MAG TPA: integrase [Algoriphagus sp.]|uniref:site-specific integrase n=1 Tax=unclassified Algoriphagus TaxID=2641541 RepID=UPI000C4823B2|nr:MULTISPECIES: site-specific integrase [unclassified Algoriphagus]MAL15107.1 integrase [Algoriphagus sp.]HAD51807.1 integrase [Algoriphagus sp.]HAH36806.1 integrase [Algoriphagus sp.]HAS57296.1 integrase [Algoriphagus sp.]HCD88662.1 integrase [Algoriphagus sp.]